MHQVRAAFGLAVCAGFVAAACASGVVRVFAARSLQFKVTLPRLAPKAAAGVDPCMTGCITTGAGRSTQHVGQVAGPGDGSCCRCKQTLALLVLAVLRRLLS